MTLKLILYHLGSFDDISLGTFLPRSPHVNTLSLSKDDRIVLSVSLSLSRFTSARWNGTKTVVANRHERRVLSSGLFQRYFPDDFHILPSREITMTVTSSWYFLRSPCGMSNNSRKSIPAYETQFRVITQLYNTKQEMFIHIYYTRT